MIILSELIYIDNGFSSNLCIRTMKKYNMHYQVLLIYVKS